MGFFRDQASRLLREKWANPSMLAEELYAMFTGDEPINIDSPVTITAGPNSTVPPLTVRNYGDDPAMIQLQRQQFPPIDFPAFPPIPSEGVGDVTYVNQYGDGTSERFDDPPPQPKPAKPVPGTGTPVVNPGGGGGSFPAVVTTGGPGNSYQCDVYLDGLANSPTSLPVRQLQIAGDATIPAGTFAVVSVVGTGAAKMYFMQVPVWGN